MTETRTPYLAVNDHDIEQLRILTQYAQGAFRDDMRRLERVLIDYERLREENKVLRNSSELMAKALLERM